MIVGATFGGRDAGQPGTLTKIYDVTKEGDNVNYDNITLSPNSNYLLLRTAWTISTGRVYGHGMYLISTPAAEAFGTVAATQVLFANTNNAGVSINFPSTGLVQWRCSNTTSRSRVRVYKIN